MRHGRGSEGWSLSSDDEISTAVERRDDVTVVTVDGVVDLATAPALEGLLTEIVDDGAACVVIDLTAVTFLASVGLRILAETHERLGGSHRFAVVASGPVTARPIQLTRLDEFLGLYPSVEDALTGLRDAAR
jgi:anti-anti-sigma factor